MRIDALNTNIVQPNYDVARTDEMKVKEREAAAAEEQKKADEAKQERQEEAAAVNASVYGNVLSEDDDGDTVAAQQQSLEALEDGLVFAKEGQDEKTAAVRQQQESVALPGQEEKSAAEKLAEEEAEKERDEDKAQAQSLTGVSADQLETMYLQGKISRYQYDQEIGRRDTLMEKEEEPVGQQEEEEDEDEENELNTERVRQEQNENNAFTQEMSRLSGGKVEEDIRADALKTANENDRVDLITKVFEMN